MSNTALNYIQVGDQTYNIGGTGGSTNGGYPIVTVEDNFNIDAQPNIFYNIKNNADSEVSINCKPEEFYAAGKDGLIFFIWENLEDTLDIIQIVNMCGIKLIADNSLQGFKYKSIISKEQLNILGVELEEDIVIYYSDYLQDGKDITAFTENHGQIILKNVQILNKDPYLCYIPSSAVGIPSDAKVPVVIAEDITNSGVDIPDGYNYAYAATIAGFDCGVFTKKSYQEDNNCIIIGPMAGGSPLDTNYELVENMNIEGSNIMKEFMFNFNSPANIIFNNIIKWNNNKEPDLTQEGVYTISIVNGVGCYTFVNS